jgi:hypothetical protein
MKRARELFPLLITDNRMLWSTHCRRRLSTQHLETYNYMPPLHSTHIKTQTIDRFFKSWLAMVDKSTLTHSLTHLLTLSPFLPPSFHVHTLYLNRTHSGRNGLQEKKIPSWSNISRVFGLSNSRSPVATLTGMARRDQYLWGLMFALSAST